MLAEYHTTRQSRLDAERSVKPLKDREDKLSDEIRSALAEADQTSAKRGDWRATLEEVAGRVSWKNEFDDLRKTAETAGIPVPDPVATPSQRLSVIPC